MRPHTWSRPKPILNVAGNTVLGHILDNLSELTTEQVIFVVGYLGDQIEDWVRAAYPHLDTHFVVQADALGQAHAVWLCRDFLDSGEVVVAFGDGIIKADFASFRTEGDGTFLVQEIEDPRSFGIVRLNDEGIVEAFVEKPETKEHKLAVVGINWFGEARRLRDAVDQVMEEGRKTKGEYFMADAYQVLLEQGAQFRTMEVEYWFDAGKPGNLLDTNRRLLSLEHASADALERSFAEGFVVVPPVYLHADCDIESSVIGPYATIEAGAYIRNSVVRNSVIDAGARIVDAVLDGSLVGVEAVVHGQASALFVGDNARVEPAH